MEANEDAVRLPAVVIASLVNLFLAAKTQRRGRAVEAARRDVRLLDLLVQGYRNEGIALELDMTVNAVKAARARIKTVLAAEAARQGLDALAIIAIRQSHPAHRAERRRATIQARVA